MMTSKKPCINNPSFSYTGNEQSPLHFGLSAEGYPINSVMEGYDKKLWAVEIKNNKTTNIMQSSMDRIVSEYNSKREIPLTPTKIERLN